MIRHGKILVTTDFSKCADEGFRRAKVLAEKLGADIHLLHVLEPVLVYGEDSMALSPVQEVTEIRRKTAEKILETYRQSSEIAIHVHLEESFQPPAQVICDFAKKLPADLIVIGSHGHSGLLDHVMIGSIAERVVCHAPCTVMVTRPHGIFE